MDVANKHDRGYLEAVEIQELEVVVRRPAPERGVGVRVFQPQPRGDKQRDRDDRDEVILKHLLRLLKRKVQDDQGEYMKSNGVRPENVHKTQKLHPKALKVTRKFILPGPITHKPRNRQPQIDQTQHQHELVHERQLLLLLQRPALLGHHATPHNRHEGRHARNGLDDSRILECVGSDVLIHGCVAGLERGFGGRGVPKRPGRGCVCLIPWSACCVCGQHALACGRGRGGKDERSLCVFW